MSRNQVPLGAGAASPVVLASVVLVTVLFEVSFFGGVVSPQPTIMPNPNSKANARIVFMSSTSKSSVIYFFAGTFPSLNLRYRPLGVYSRVSYNFFQIGQSAG